LSISSPSCCCSNAPATTKIYSLSLHDALPILKMKGVEMIGGVSYDRIDDKGLHITVGGESQLLEVDNVVLCAGQESLRELYRENSDGKARYHLIGGADLAAELDAKRAIRQGSELAARL